MQKLIISHPLSSSRGAWHDEYKVFLVICHRHRWIKAANVVMYLQWTCFISLLLLSLWMSLIECWRFCMIYQLTSRVGNASHACSHTGANTFLIREWFVAAFNYPSKAFLTFITNQETHCKRFITLWKNTTWLIAHVGVIVEIDHWNHVFAWCRHHDSLVTVFTLYSGPGSWKTNILLPVNECSLINYVTSMIEFSGTSLLMAPVDSHLSCAAPAADVSSCLRKSVLLLLFQHVSCVWQLVPMAVCLTYFFFLLLTVSCRNASGRKTSEKTTAAILTTPPLARGASPQILGRTSDTRSAAYRSVRKVIESQRKPSQ